MIIVDGQVFAIRIPLKHPFKIALGTLTHSNHVLVRLVDDANGVGWGESTTFHTVYGYDQKSLYHVLTDHLIPAIKGIDPRNMDLLHQRLDLAMPSNLMAKCAVDLAAYDLIGRTDGVPIHSLVGHKRVDRIPITVALGIVSPKEAAAKAKELAAEGFEVIKVKIGLDAEEDLERIKAVKEAVGDDVKLRVDANQGYDRVDALRVLTRMEAMDLEWIEQPLPDWDLEGLAMLADRLDTPIALDESVFTLQDTKRVIAAGAADVVNIKVPKCGGIYRSQQIASLCEEAEIPCFLGGCIETTPGTAAQAHFYCSTQNIISAAEMEGPWCYIDDVVKAPLKLEKGKVKVPDAPGLGVTIDEEKVARYRIDF